MTEGCLRTRKLGAQGLVVSELGLGCMGMSEFYGERDDAESVATIHRAIDLGVDFWAAPECACLRDKDVSLCEGRTSFQ